MRSVISPHCESHIIQDLVEGWEPLATYVNLFHHNLSIALPAAGSESESECIGTLSVSTHM